MVFDTDPYTGTQTSKTTTMDAKNVYSEDLHGQVYTKPVTVSVDQTIPKRLQLTISAPMKLAGETQDVLMLIEIYNPKG